MPYVTVIKQFKVLLRFVVAEYDREGESGAIGLELALFGILVLAYVIDIQYDTKN